LLFRGLKLLLELGNGLLQLIELLYLKDLGLDLRLKAELGSRWWWHNLWLNKLNRLRVRLKLELLAGRLVQPEWLSLSLRLEDRERGLRSCTGHGHVKVWLDWRCYLSESVIHLAPLSRLLHYKLILLSKFRRHCARHTDLEWTRVRLKGGCFFSQDLRFCLSNLVLVLGDSHSG
jgi:hypothetical protein